MSTLPAGWPFLHPLQDLAIQPSDDHETDPANQKASQDVARIMDSEIDAAVAVEQGPDNEQSTQERGMASSEGEGFGLAPEQPAEPESDGEAVGRMA